MKKYNEPYLISNLIPNMKILYKGSRYIVKDINDSVVRITNGYRTISLNQSQFNRDVQINECLEEYIVKKGYSLDSWKKLSDQEKKDIKDKYKNQRVWRVVHGNKKGQIGKPINSYKNPDGSTKYTNYDKALSIHNAIVLNKENILSDGELIIEGKIKDIYIIAQNSKSYEEFVQIMKQEYPNLRLTKSILQKIYDDAKEMMQESFIKLISLIKPKKKS